MDDIWQLSPAEGASPDPDQSALQAGTVNILTDLEPLDAQTDRTDRKTVPDALHGLLFESVSDPVSDVTPPCYAILDAAKIPNLPELLAASDLKHRCLFKDAAFEELSHVAPWIVALEDGNGFVRSLFTRSDPVAPWDNWDRDAGIFIRSDATLDALWAHFRKFTKVRMEAIAEGAQGDWQYFRFYEPEQAALYFEAIRAWPDRMVQFFRTKEGVAVDAIIAVSSVAATAHVFTPGPLPEEKPAPFTFQPRDAAVFVAARKPRFRQELHDWLLRMDAPRFKPFSEDQLYALVDHGLREGDALSFTFKEEYVYLLYMMSYCGGWFHKSGRMPEISRILLEDGRARRVNLEGQFPRSYDRLYGNRADLYRAWSAPMGKLAAQREKQGGWDGFSPKSAYATIAACATHLQEEDRTRLTEFLRRVELDCDNRKIMAPHARGIALLFSFTMGHAFFGDPLFPWASEMAAEHATLDAALPEIADYGLKRARKMLAALEKGVA